MPSVDLGNVVGPQGPAPDITATASVDNNSGTPSVDVTKTGSTATPNFDFAFHNLHGVVDDALSTSSTNPVQNKVVTTALNGKVANTDSRLSDARNLYNATPTSDSTVYLRRQTTGGMCAIKKIVGGSVVKNQQVPNGNFTSVSNWSRDGITEANFTVSSNVASVTTASADGSFRGIYSSREIPFVKDHKYFISVEVKCTAANYIATAYAGNNSHRILRTEYSRITMTDADTWYKHTKVLNAENNFDVQSNSNFRVGLIGKLISSSTTLSIRNVNLIDLTQMFDNTIADYIYTLEQATAGSGIAKLAEWGFDLSVYHAYDARSLQSVKLAGKKALDSDNNEIGFTPMSPTNLRGIYSLDASNNLVSDGDEYYPDGEENVKYMLVHLGDITPTHYTVSGGLSLFRFPITGIKTISDSSVAPKAICAKYPTTSVALRADKTMSQPVSTNALDIIDNAYTDAATFKTAMNGVYVVCEKSTPSSAQLSPYQSLESIASNGTEEYIDYGVQQGTRDLAIPPYSSAEYTDGNADNVIASGDVIDGYNNVLREKENHRDLISLLGDDESGRTTASRAYSVNEFFYKDGAVYKVTASIASGAAFTVGTNCTQTTIFAVLTALLNA